MKNSTKAEAKSRFEESLEKRREIRQLVQAGQWQQAEPVVERRQAFELRRQRRLGRLPGGARESIQGDVVDFQPVAFLNEGAVVRRAIGKVEVNAPDVVDWGTGFLVSPELFLTNQHVVTNEAAAGHASVVFDYEVDDRGGPVPITTYTLDPARFSVFSPEEDLDFALVALGRRVQGPARPADLGYCPLSNTRDRHRLGMNVNVIQHPGGRLKSVVVRNNLLTYRTEDRLLYETDTLKGSSGAPVFNDDWDVVALHHWGESSEGVDEDGNPIPREVNEGIRISSIYDFLLAQTANQAGERRELLERALALFDSDRRRYEDTLPRVRPRRGSGLRRRPPQDRSGREADGAVSGSSLGDELRFTIPIEVSVRAPSAARRVVDGRPSFAVRGGPLLSAAEGKKKDPDYTNRNGFDQDFVEGVTVDLDRIVDPVKAWVTPLKADQPQADRGELQYQNFSVILCTDRRLAWISAANIDGDEYLRVDRESGEVVGSEGESWYVDQRIDREAYLDQDFYGGWSHIFDRGHLTRRNDPTWGTETEAKRANADTFHFSNCSPQQWRFNQTLDFWQGLERYVLERGILDVAGADTRVTVLQGPVFDDTNDPWADDVQIPGAYWKLVLWRNDQGPRVVAMVASQDGMLDEFRSYVRRPDADATVDVNEFRVSAGELSQMTGLDLSDLEPFDTIAEADQPGVGEGFRVRRRQAIRSWDDIRL